MADERGEQPDPSPGHSEPSSFNEGRGDAGRRSQRRRIIVTGLLTPPAVMTLNARSARAQASTHPSMDPSYGKGKGKG